MDDTIFLFMIIVLLVKIKGMILYKLLVCNYKTTLNIEGHFLYSSHILIRIVSIFTIFFLITMKNMKMILMYLYMHSPFHQRNASRLSFDNEKKTLNLSRSICFTMHCDWCFEYKKCIYCSLVFKLVMHYENEHRNK